MAQVVRYTLPLSPPCYRALTLCIRRLSQPLALRRRPSNPPGPANLCVRDAGTPSPDPPHSCHVVPANTTSESARTHKTAFGAHSHALCVLPARRPRSPHIGQPGHSSSHTPCPRVPQPPFNGSDVVAARLHHHYHVYPFVTQTARDARTTGVAFSCCRPRLSPCLWITGPIVPLVRPHGPHTAQGNLTIAAERLPLLAYRDSIE